MSPPKVVIIGGGVGGAAAAQSLYGVADVTVIDRREYFELPYPNIRIPVDPSVTEKSTWLLADTPKIGKVVLGSATQVTESEVVVDNGTRLPYDYLILATGSIYADPVSSGTTTSYSARKQEYISANKSLVRAQTCLIIGGGSVGQELAGEIATDYPAKKVTLVHSGDCLLPDYPSKAGELILGMLKKQGVEVILNDRAVKAGSGYILEQSGRQLQSDIVYICTGGKPNTDFLRAGNADVLTDKGFIKVDDNLRVENRANWFAIGDITSLPDGRLGRVAHDQGEYVGHLVKASQAGEAALKKVKPWKKNGGLELIIVTLGRKAAVMSVFGWSFGGTRWSPGGLLPVAIKSGDNLVGMTRGRMGMPKA